MDQSLLLGKINELVRNKCLRAAQVSDLQLNLKRFTYEEENLVLMDKQIDIMVAQEAKRKELLALARKKSKETRSRYE